LKDHISALEAQLTRLEPLLALERCAEPGETFEGDSLGVRPEGGNQVIHLTGSPSETLIVGALAGDTMSLTLAVGQDRMPADLLTCLRLLGTSAKGAIGAGASIDVEQYLTRVQTLQHVAILARFVAEHSLGHVAETVEALLNVARTLRARRDAVFELENTASTRPRTLAAAQQQLQLACDAVQALQQQLGQSAVLHLRSDPRGVALELHAKASGRRLGLTGMSITWAVPETLELTSSRKRGTGRTSSFAPPSKTTVDPEVISALQSAVTNGRELAISERLAPRAYAKVKAVLASLGGRWNSSKQAHVFAGEAAEVLQSLLAGAVVTDRDWEFFPTPKPLVTRLLAKAGVQPGWRVREPQAGQGAIAMALAEIVGIEQVTCTEAMPKNAQHLRGLGFKVNEGDFLLEAPSPTCDAIVMNPPFSGHQDAAHITHALGFIRPGGVLAAIASPSWRLAHTAKAAAFRELLDTMGAEVEDIPAGAFRESGTDVATVMITIRMPGPSSTTSRFSAERRASDVGPLAPAGAAQLELCL